MGKVKKNKETAKEEKPKVVKVSNKTLLKAKKTVKPKKILTPKKLEKKIKVKKEIVLNSAQVTKEQLENGISALLQYEEKNQTKDLFTREKPLFLQIDAVKIPHCPSRRIRFPLKHTLLTDKQEVCLIVPDLKQGRRIDHEPTIQHYEDILRTKKVQSIKRILPIRQLRVEYDQFELKRRLCGYYDYFLVAGNISGHVIHLLGKTFIEKRKAPIPINLKAANLNDAVEKALKKTSIHIHPNGSTYIVQFGHSEMSIEQLTDNVKAISDSLVSNFPGGWANIRSLHIKTDKSIAVPVYYTLKSANKVTVPVLKPSRPKEYTKVTDELSTKISKNKVTVHPGGKVELLARKTTPEVSNNQLRKIRQGKIQKRSLIIRTKTAKIKARKVLKAKLKKDKLKKQRSGDVVVPKEEKKNKQEDKTVVKQEKTVVKQEKTVVKQEKTVVKQEKTVEKQKKTLVKKENATVEKQLKVKEEVRVKKVKAEKKNKKVKKEKPALQNGTPIKKDKKIARKITRNKSKKVA